MKIGLISDTHGFLGKDVLKHLDSCDEVWHLGDFGENVASELSKMHKIRGVYGNIDDLTVRSEFPEFLFFELSGLKFLFVHIGGYPGRYSKKSRELIIKYKPDFHLTGHSHICKIMRDKKNNLVHLNPGACGKQGFHAVRTMITFVLNADELVELKVIELGDR